MAAFMSPVPLLDGVSNRLWSWLPARIGRIIGRTPGLSIWSRLLIGVRCFQAKGKPHEIQNDYF